MRDRTEFCIIEDRSSRPEPRLASSLQIAAMGKSSLLTYIARPTDRDSIRFREIPSRNEWAVEVLFSPVIELQGCFMDESILRIGRMFYEDGFYSQNDSWVNKHDNFLKWAKDIFSLTKSVFRYDKSHMAYIGPDAEKWASATGHQLTAN